MTIKQATAAEKDHMRRVKELPCGLCNKYPPSDAHHLLDFGRRISHFLTIPLCKICHQDNLQGIHGQKTAWRILKKTELQILADTIGKLERGI